MQTVHSFVQITDLALNLQKTNTHADVVRARVTVNIVFLYVANNSKTRHTTRTVSRPQTLTQIKSRSEIKGKFIFKTILQIFVNNDIYGTNTGDNSTTVNI